MTVTWTKKNLGFIIIIIIIIIIVIIIIIIIFIIIVFFLIRNTNWASKHKLCWYGDTC